MITIYSIRRATIQDLKLELWLRQHNSGSIIWTTKDGKNIPIKDMGNNHLVNALKMLLIQKEKQREYDDIMVCDESDIL